MAQSQVIKKTDLILIGKTGHGKSCTGNTLLYSGNASSVTKIRQSKTKSVENRVLTVVDTPGLADTCLKNEEEKLKLVTGEVEAIINENPEGFDACLIVLKYPVRFTPEEQYCIKALKDIFGVKLVKKHCILIMTGGDDFEYDHRISKNSFMDWCRQQTGQFEKLFAECEGKIVLFNNRKTGDGRISQVQELLRMVDTIGGKYTDKHFQKARNSREIMMLNAKLPGITDATMKVITIIYQNLQEIEKRSGFKDIKEVVILHTEAKSLLDKLVKEDNKTGVLSSLIKTVQSLESTISEEIKVRERVAQEIENRGDPEILRLLEFLQFQQLMSLLATKSDFERDCHQLRQTEPV